MMTGKRVFALVIIVVNIVGSLGASPNRALRSVDPDLFPTCKRGSDDVNGCVKNAIEVIFAKLIYGIPSLNISKCEPLKVGNILFNKDLGMRFNVSMLFKDIELGKFDSVKIKDVVVHPDLTSFKINITNEEVIMSANYEFFGEVLAFPISGTDKFTSTSTNLAATVSINTKKVQKDGKDYLIVDSVSYPVNMENLTFNFQGLNYGGFIDINEILNLNRHLMGPDLIALMQVEMEKAIKELASKFFDHYSLDDILPL